MPRPGEPIRIVPRPSPVEVRGEIRGILNTQPHEVFGQLGGERGQVLPAAERVQIARQAVNRLAVQVEAAKDPRQALAQVRTAGQNAGNLDAAVRRDLQTLARVAEQRVLTQATGEVRLTLERGQWPEAARLGESRLRQVRELGPEAARHEAVGTLAEVVRVGRAQEALGRLQEGLRTGALDKVPAEQLPGRLRDGVEGLRGLEAVREIAARRVLTVGDAAALRRNLALFEKAARALPDADLTLGGRILQDLAMRQFLEGRTAEYRALMPADGPPDHAAQLLRDMKALALGQGEVATWPAKRALPAEPGKGGDAPRGPPPGLKPLLPEGPRDGWRPVVRESARAEMPPLEKAAQTGKALRAKVETDLKAEQTALDTQTKQAREHLQTVNQRLEERAKVDAQRMSEVETVLARKLEPAERVQVWQLLAQNQTSQQIATAVKSKADRDEEQYIREVIALLGRALTPDEFAQVRQWRRQGKTPADAVALLRTATKRPVKAALDMGP
jgi:hypothetical protein